MLTLATSSLVNFLSCWADISRESKGGEYLGDERTELTCR